MSDRIHTGSPLPWSYSKYRDDLFWKVLDANGMTIGSFVDERDAMVACRAVNGFIPMREFVAAMRFLGRDCVDMARDDAFEIYKDV